MNYPRINKTGALLFLDLMNSHVLNILLTILLSHIGIVDLLKNAGDYFKKNEVLAVVRSMDGQILETVIAGVRACASLSLSLSYSPSALLLRTVHQ